MASNACTEQPKGAKMGSWPPTYIGSSPAIVCSSPNTLKFLNPNLDIRPSLKILTPRRGVALWARPFASLFETLAFRPEFRNQVRPNVEFYIAPTLAFHQDPPHHGRHHHRAMFTGPAQERNEPLLATLSWGLRLHSGAFASKTMRGLRLQSGDFASKGRRPDLF